MCVIPHFSSPGSFVCRNLTGSVWGAAPADRRIARGEPSNPARVRVDLSPGSPCRSMLAHSPSVPPRALPAMSDFEKTPPDVAEILGKRISQLGLRLEGSPVERFVQQLVRELERKRVRRFRPVCYLTDEWGCPDGQPVIGIPFYLADPQLAHLEKAMNDLEDEREIMMYLRHEAGHAFNYAYRLYVTSEWRALFGPYNRRYRDHYRPVPFSRKYVRHIAGWYAQKHPDEDFAETFAVWLTPRSNWRRKYKTWPAGRKLRYVDRMVRQMRDQDPIVSTGDFDRTVEDMKETVGEFYRRLTRQNGAAVNVALES